MPLYFKSYKGEVILTGCVVARLSLSLRSPGCLPCHSLPFLCFYTSLYCRLTVIMHKIIIYAVTHRTAAILNSLLSNLTPKLVFFIKNPNIFGNKIYLDAPISKLFFKITKLNLSTLKHKHKITDNFKLNSMNKEKNEGMHFHESAIFRNFSVCYHGNGCTF